MKRIIPSRAIPSRAILKTTVNYISKFYFLGMKKRTNDFTSATEYTAVALTFFLLRCGKRAGALAAGNRDSSTCTPAVLHLRKRIDVIR